MSEALWIEAGGTAWQPHEIEFVRANHETMTVRQLAEGLFTGDDRVRSKLRYLGLQARRAEPVAPPRLTCAAGGRATGAWTLERENAAEKLWLEGYSAAQIAKALGGLSRSAVLGKLARLGIKRPYDSATDRRRHNGGARPVRAVKPPKPPRPPKPPTRATVAAREGVVVRLPTPKRVETVRDPSTLVPLVKLGAHMCRWPFGDPQDAAFGHCGHRRPAGATYCAEHARIAYQPPAKRKPKPSADILDILAKRAAYA